MRRKLRHLLKGEYVRKGMCFTGAEPAALAAMEAAALTGSGTAIGAGLEAALAPSLLGTIGGFVADNALSLGLQGAGGLLKANAASDAADRRERLVNAMGAYQTGNAQKGTALTEKYLEGSTPEARAASNDAAISENRLGYEKTVGASQAFERPGGVAGNLSEGYKAASATSADAQAARTKALIENLAKMRAPGVTGANEARRYGRAAGEIGGLNNANASVGNAYRTDIANVQEDPWATMGGDALSGIGSGLALKNSLAKLRASAL